MWLDLFSNIVCSTFLFYGLKNPHPYGQKKSMLTLLSYDRIIQSNEHKKLNGVSNKGNVIILPLADLLDVFNFNILKPDKITQMNFKKILLWVLRLIPAIIMLQTLFFKFTAAPESIYIFSTLGMEPYGRIGTGVIELIASILILVPRTTWLGALMGFGTMLGAIFFHLTQLGIEVQGDGGYLFILAIVVLTLCGILIFLNRKQVPILKQFF